MVEVKFFEVRDKGTFIPVVCLYGNMVETEEPERWLLARAGWVEDQTFCYLAPLTGRNEIHYDPYKWQGSRTFAVAHEHIRENWGELENGSVIDVEFILGLTDAPKESERHTDPLSFMITTSSETEE